MILRSWRGATRAADADRYVDYLRETGLRAFEVTPGNRGFIVLRRVEDDRAEFVVQSFWESMDAVKAFAGERPEVAVFYPEDDRYLIAREATVEHFEITDLRLSREATAVRIAT
jgi:heme-degrading monooxygenase HmoA